MKHTPGPWKYENIPGKRNDGSFHHLHRIAQEKTNQWFGINMEDTGPNDNPDAHLIAAAPELLEACKDALKTLEALMLEEDPQASTQMEWEGLNYLREAIAKAEGRE